MTGGFNDPIIGGGGALVYPAIHSPNFVHGSTGWTIKKDGSAEFNNLTIRGTFFGTDYIINSNGLFFYSPTEASGNLIISVTPAPCTGPFGETIPVSGIQVINTTFGTTAQLVGGELLLFSGATETTSLGPSGITSFGSGNQVANLLGAVLSFFDSASAQAVSPQVSAAGSAGAGVGSQLFLDSGRGGAGAADAIIELLSSDSPATTVPLINVTAGIIALVSTRAQIHADNWKTVGAVGQPAFVNSFSAGGTAPRFQYEPDIGGRVRLSGAVNTGANTLANTTIFTLPAGYVPSRQLGFVTANNVTAYALGSASIQVTTAGAVQLVPAGTAGKFVLLDGCCFELD